MLIIFLIKIKNLQILIININKIIIKKLIKNFQILDHINFLIIITIKTKYNLTKIIQLI